MRKNYYVTAEYHVTEEGIEWRAIIWLDPSTHSLCKRVCESCNVYRTRASALRAGQKLVPLVRLSFLSGKGVTRQLLDLIRAQNIDRKYDIGRIRFGRISG